MGVNSATLYTWRAKIGPIQILTFKVKSNTTAELAIYDFQLVSTTAELAIYDFQLVSN